MTWYLFFLGIAACSLIKGDSNLSLPVSQQPGPLVGFGGNVVDKGTAQAYLYGDAFIGKDRYNTDLIPGILYGIRNDLSLFFNIPFAPANATKSSHSSGIEDIYLQPEYAYYTKNTPLSSLQATILANVTFPTGSITKTPSTGSGAPTFFLGTTLNYTGISWFAFTAYGATFPLKGPDIQYGKEFQYQYGLGRGLPSPSGWIFAWMIEGDGTYCWKNTVHHTKNPNSGGNTFYITPSLWISSSRILLQIGAGYPVLQHLFGNQLTNYLFLTFNFGVTF